jgi:tRNA (mo5U34)-methyltransferase
MTDPRVEQVDDAMASIRKAVEGQLGTERPAWADVDPSTLVRFSGDLPEQLPAEERQRLEERAEQLQPWLQGPFLLGGDLIVGGAWRNDQRWVLLGDELPQDMSGVRVLDVGCNAGYDPFMFHLRGADYVLGCEPFEFIEQAFFLEGVYRSGVDFQRIGWQQLDPAQHGVFDIVHCHGVLYHEPDPMALLSRLWKLTAPGGTLLLGSMQLADAAMSDYARFVPLSYYGDPTWWWVPGRLALRWMIESSGFDVQGTFGESPGPPGEFETINGYVRGIRTERVPASA